MNGAERVTRGRNAERLLNDETLREAFDVVSVYHTGVFGQVTATEAEVLQARHRLLALNEVKGQLKSFIMDGKLADK
jgi:hypothetical protein